MIEISNKHIDLEGVLFFPQQRWLRPLLSVAYVGGRSSIHFHGNIAMVIVGISWEYFFG